MIANNLISMTRQFLASAGATFGGKRDLYEIFGYKKKIKPEDHHFRYRRQDIASRIVNAYPNACWACPPVPTNDSESQEESPWEKKFAEEAKRLKLWQVIRKADILAQLNEYSIILLGISGSNDISEPVSGKANIVYMKAFGSNSASINTWEEDVNNERFGLPLTYKLNVSGSRSKRSTKTVIVHYSRVIHIAERTLEDPVYGVPYLESVWNRMDDLEKLTGSSGEMWWLNGRAGLNIDIDPDVDMDNDDKEALENQLDNYNNKLSRTIKTQGVEVKPLTMAVPNPKEHFDVYISLISGTTSIPKRVLTGSESGELASSQDKNNFDSAVKERRATFCEPEILDATMTKLMDLGLIVDTEFEWVWPELDTVSDKEQAEIAAKKSQAIATYTNAPASDTVITPMQFVQDILKMKFREDELADMESVEDDEIEIDDNERSNEDDSSEE